MGKEYIITDGVNYIRQNIDNKYIPTKNMSLADTYSKSVAINILKTALNKKYRRDYYLAYIENGEVIKCGFTEREKTIRRKNMIGNTNEAEKEIVYDRGVFTEQDNVMRWIDRIKVLQNLHSDMQRRKLEIQDKLSIIDGILNDMKHHREFTKLNACNGYKRDDIEHEVLKRERALKNEYEVINIISNISIDDNKTNNILKNIDKIGNKTYKPRVLGDIFTTNIFSKEKVLEIIADDKED